MRPLLLLSLMGCQRVVLIDSSDTAPPGPTGWLSQGEVQDCSAPVASADWEEVGAELGFIDGPSLEASHERNGGLSVVDLDLDGDLDIVVGFDLIGHDDGSWIRTDTYLREGDSYRYEAMGLTMMGVGA